MAEEHEFKIMQNTLKFLRWHAMWPPEGKAFSVGIIFYIKMITILLLLGIPISMMPLATLSNILINRLDHTITESMGLLITSVGFLYIQINYVMKQSKIAIVCRKLSDFESFGKPPDFDEENSKWNRMAILYKCYTFIAIAIYGFLKQYEAPMCEKNNRDKGLNEICGLYVPAYVPFEFYKKDKIIFIYQVVAVIQIASGSSTISFSTLDMAQHICCRIKHLNKLLVEMFDDKDQHHARLCNCIRYHQFIIDITKDFNVCYRNIMGCYVVMAGVIFGCLANIWIEESSLGSFLHLVGWIIALYVVCFAGQALTSASDTIATAAYSAKWEDADLEHKKMFLFMLMRSQKLMYLQGQPVGTMCLPLFGQLMKASYSYFTLLNRTEE